MMPDVALRTRRRARPRIMLPLWSLLILVIGWAALWLFGRHEAARAIDALIAGEELHGRTWTCPDRGISGFPLRIRVTCTQPTFRGELGGDVVDASLAGLEAEAFIYQPNAVDLSAIGPLTLRRQDESAPVTLAWSGLKLILRGLAAGRKRAALMIEGPDLSLPGGPAGRADRLELRIGPAAGRPAEESADEVWLTLAGARIPALDPLTGNSEPLDIGEKGLLTHVGVPRVPSWPNLAEAWRADGGRFELSTLSVAKGELRIAASGSLGLDDAHRPAGRLDAAMSGYEPLAAALGIPVRAVAAGGLLAQLLGRNGTDPAPAVSDRPTLRLPIVLADGRVSIGPVKTGLRLLPLY